MNQQPSIKKRRIGTPGFWILIAVGAIIAVVVLAILIDSAVYYNKVHAGVSVSGIDLGGQTKDEAIASVTSAGGQGAEQPHHPHRRRQDLDAHARRRGHQHGRRRRRQGGHGRQPRATTSSPTSAPAGSCTSASKTFPSPAPWTAPRCDGFVAGIAKELDVAPVNAGLAIENGKIKVIESRERAGGRPGRLWPRQLERAARDPPQHHGRGARSWSRSRTSRPRTTQAAQQQAETMISGAGHRHRRRQELDHHRPRDRLLHGLHARR